METSRENQQRIFALAFHVDYWNYLHWVDPFSEKRFTQRQHTYARALPSQVYTPQMVVNGQYGFVGSNRRQGVAAVQHALETPASVGLILELQSIQGNQLVVQYQLSSTPDNPQVLNLALAERDIVRKIGAGENSGRTLIHSNVVRAFHSIPVDEKSAASDTSLLPTVNLEFPDDVVRENSSLIGYVQHPQTMRVLGAYRLDL